MLYIFIIFFSLEHNGSGRILDIYSTQAGLQVYSANYVDLDTNTKNGQKYGKHCAIALEPQNYPDAVNQVHKRLFQKF